MRPNPVPDNFKALLAGLSLLTVGSFLTGCLQEPVTSEAQSSESEKSTLPMSAFTSPTYGDIQTSMIARNAAPTFLDPTGNMFDWAFYGMASAQTITVKANVPANRKISKSSSGNVLQYAPPLFGYPNFKWSNGEYPYVNAETPNGIRVGAVGNKFNLSTPTIVNKATEVRVYYSVYKCAAEVQSFANGTSIGKIQLIENQTGSTPMTWVSALHYYTEAAGTVSFELRLTAAAAGAALVVHAISYGDYVYPDPTPILPLPAFTAPPFHRQGELFRLAVANYPSLTRGVNYYRDGGKIGENTSYPYDLPNFRETIAGTHYYEAEVVDWFGKKTRTSLTAPIWNEVNVTIPNGSIPDNNPTGISFTGNIANTQGTVKEIRTVMNITHTYDGDLEMEMQPANTSASSFLIRGVGGGGANFTNTNLRSDATTHITGGSAPFTGDFQPYETFSEHYNINPNGAWKFTIRDIAPQDVGTIKNFKFWVRCAP